jgi:ATP-binding cassette, subfamily B (MDR/TAP), member 1
MLLIFGVGGRQVAKYAKLAVNEYSAAATIAEEVISSVRTAQAFGTEDKLAHHYDDNLVIAEKAGYKKTLVLAVMFACIFPLIYLAYGLAFCIVCVITVDGRGGLPVNCGTGIDYRTRV